MTPAIIDQVSKCKFNPTEYTWIDLGNTPPPNEDQYKSMLDSGIGFLFSTYIDKLPMPFEKFAVVRKGNSEMNLTYTFERTSEKLSFKVRSAGVECVAEAWQVGDQIYAKCLDLFLEASKKVNPAADLDYVRMTLISLGKEILHTITWLSINKNSVPAYSCSNATNNAKRISKGKKPIYEWKILDINPTVPGLSLGGSHATPRGHTRRGHPRKLKSGKVIWIKECLVGDFSKGCVFHDYKAKGETNERFS